MAGMARKSGPGRGCGISCALSVLHKSIKIRKDATRTTNRFKETPIVNGEAEEVEGGRKRALLGHVLA